MKSLFEWAGALSMLAFVAFLYIAPIVLTVGCIWALIHFALKFW